MARNNTGKSVGSTDSNKLGRELVGLFVIFFGLLLLLSLATFDSRDPWLNHVVSDTSSVHNKAGLFGSYISGMLFDILGVSAWVVPLSLCFLGARRILDSQSWPWWRWLGFLFLIICASMAGAARDLYLTSAVNNTPGVNRTLYHGGGFLGHILYTKTANWLNVPGAWLVWLFLFLLAIQLMIGFSWVPVCMRTVNSLWHHCKALVQTVDRPTSAAETAEIQEIQENISQNHAVGDPSLKKRQTFITSLKKKIKSDQEPTQSLVITPFDNELRMPSAEDEEPAWLKDMETDRIGVRADSSLFSTAKTDSTVDRGEGSSSASLLDFFPPQDKNNQGDQAPANPMERSKTTHMFSTSASSSPPEKTAHSLKISFSGGGKATPLPALDLLESIPSSGQRLSEKSLEEKGRAVIACLQDFGIQCELVGITPGPVVTMFEVRPAPGIRVARIANLSDDLALALKSIAVRVQAPVPGTDKVGIEIPNAVREAVCLKSLLAAGQFQHSSSLLTLALGTDIAGVPVTADLASMPHLLVAGATGAGKSVGINAILLSLLYKARPEEVKILLIDPKRVEMAIYADLPHLVHPVVTEMHMAKNALDWAVDEMEKRYAAIAKASVRNITDYNEKIRKWGGTPPEGMEDLEPMPYLVVVIDELADLMLVAAKEVETSIVRLAQLARAAGIHLILATQRPSVDVVTGLIKANFPCRISFQVTSKHDSRTILDTGGAEQLLGRGDMLFKPSGGKLQRLHGAYVSDTNVFAVVSYWKTRQLPDYKIDFSEWEGEALSPVANGDGSITADPVYAEACDFVRQQKTISISLLQRRFRIGYNRAARFIDQMEHDGIISAPDGSKPRTVLQ